MEASSLMMLFPVFNSSMRTRGLLVPLYVLSACQTPFGTLCIEIQIITGILKATV